MQAIVSRRTHLHVAVQRLICVVFLTFMYSSTASSEPSMLGIDIPYAFIKDTPGQLTLNQAAGMLEDMPATETAIFSQGYVSDTYWLKFELPTKLFAGQTRWLELGPNFVDDIRLFYRPTASDLPWQLKQTGDVLLGRSDIDYRNPVFIIPPPDDNQGYEAIIRVRSSSSTLLQATLWEPAEFVGHAAATTSFWSFYFGLVAISSLLAAILAVVLGGRLLWSVTAFSVTYLLVASVQGYPNWLLPDLGIPVQHYLTSTMALLSYMMLLWLCAETVDMRRNLPWAYKIMMTCCGLTLLLLALIPLDLYGLAIKLHVLFYLPTSVAFIFSIFYVWRREQFRLSTLLLGLSPLICITTSTLGLASAFGWIPFNNDVYVIWQYALLANTILVMAIAVYRIREKKLEEFEKHQLASELKAERDASFHQRQFMGMVSHEFRTPLAVISGSLENLRCIEPENNHQRSRYNKIQRATERLVQLTDNCLADARLAADTLYLDPQPSQLFELIDSATSMVQMSDAHQLVLSIEGKPVGRFPASGCTVIVDTALVRIALSNVIDNAVKYSTGGNIHIGYYEQDGQPTVRICDQGPGISTEDAEHIFDRYRRGAHNKRGAGLGLFLARQIARAHGGDLQLHSSSSEGSCFIFVFNNSEREPQGS